MSRQGTPCGGWTLVPRSQRIVAPARATRAAPSHERGQDADLVEAHLWLVRLAHHRLLHPHAQLAGELRARLPRGRPLLDGWERAGGQLSPVELSVAHTRVDRHAVRLVGRLFTVCVRREEEPFTASGVARLEGGASASASEAAAESAASITCVHRGRGVNDAGGTGRGGRAHPRRTSLGLHLGYGNITWSMVHGGKTTSSWAANCERSEMLAP